MNHITGICKSCPQCGLGLTMLYINPAKNKGAGAKVNTEYKIRMSYL